MTTAGRPTWDSAKGGRGKWEGDLSAISKQYSVRDLPAHTKLKVRQEGQGRPEDLQGKDFKRNLEEKEKRLALEKSGKTSSTLALTASATAGERRSNVPDVTDSSSGGAKRPKTETVASVSTANLDADDPWEEDYEDEQDVTQQANRVDMDEQGANPEEDDDDEEDEDEALLLAELAKIKRERAEDAARLAAERKAAEETIRMENILRGNPLLNTTGPSEFKVKRRWDDDVVFKNCARGESDHSKRGFINDTLRSEFHKKFMKKYIQ